MAVINIIDRGRGPEIEGTRITIYRVMDFVVDGQSMAETANQLALTTEEVQAALDYIGANRNKLEEDYQKILLRASQRRNPEWVDARLAKTAEELKQRILARRCEENCHAGGGR